MNVTTPKLALLIFLISGALQAATPLSELRVGRSLPAFDHLGNIGDQAPAAAAAGFNCIYATGVGSLGYSGLPSPEALASQGEAVSAYNQNARREGVRVIFGYVCATSIVKLESFTAGWTPEFRRQFSSPPAEWRQQGRDGRPLPSWYGGDYVPACMNHPDWRRYEQFIVRQQLLTGHDGIFFDNPTVHPKGCYCLHCMQRFAVFLKDRRITVKDDSWEGLRQAADTHPREFLRYRSTIARDFLAEMRRFARSLNPRALMTCNNSLNAPHVLYSQSRTYGYNIFEKSQAEDLVVVEDMSHQPRQLPNGRFLEYGPTYRQLAALSHGKPVVAVTIAEGDYHTPPHLVRLAMAEAAAHEASYLGWPTWPAEQRSRMAEVIRPQAEFLKLHESLLNETSPRQDVLLFLPTDGWLDSDVCSASQLATALSRQNIQYRVATEHDLSALLRQTPRLPRRQRPVLVVEPTLAMNHRTLIENLERRSGAVIYEGASNIVVRLHPVLQPTARLIAPSSVRMVVRDQPGRTLVHLYNLGIERLSSFEDRVHPVSDLKLQIWVPFKSPRSVRALSADAQATSGELPFQSDPTRDGSWIKLDLARLEISSILVISD